MESINLLRKIKMMGIAKYRLQLRDTICNHKSMLNTYNGIQIYNNKKKYDIDGGITKCDVSPSESISKLDNCDLIDLIVYTEGEALKYISKPSYIIHHFARELGYEKHLRISTPEELLWNDDSKALALSQGNFDDFNDCSSEVLLKAVKLNSNLITKIPNPSEELKIEAINMNPKLIGIIKNPSINLMKQAVSLNPYCLFDIVNPPLEVQIEAINKNHNLIFEIENPSFEILLEGVKIWPYFMSDSQFNSLIKQVIPNTMVDVKDSKGIDLVMAAIHSYFYSLYDYGKALKYGKACFLRSFLPETIEYLMPWINKVFKSDTQAFLNRHNEEYSNYVNYQKKLKEELSKKNYSRDNYYDNDYEEYDDYEEYEDYEESEEKYQKELNKEMHWEDENYAHFEDGYYSDDEDLSDYCY